MNPNLERAREEAARAFHSTLLSEGVIIQTNALDAALGAFLAAARADGWKLVRREASEEMAERARDAIYASETSARRAALVWSAMWDMAPEVKP